ncbi:MAG: hypothetical protein ACTSPV_19855 [Candidatus Hodarchaeales archaeon]
MVVVPVSILMFIDISWGCWINDISSHIFAFLSIMLTISFLILSLILFYKMLNEVPASKKERILLLAKGISLIGIGFVFIILGGGIRALGLINQLSYVVYITQSLLAWLIWLIAISYFYRGIPNREAYFFDELNQILVYKLNLPLGTNLDEIFLLHEKNAVNSRQIIENKLKRRSSISEYLEELSREFT